jgi:hypothetical protein
MKNFRVLLVGSLALAMMTFAAPWLTSIRVSLFLAGLWGAVVLAALFRFRRRGVWLLLGTPLALYWLYVFVVLCHDFGSLC